MSAEMIDVHVSLSRWPFRRLPLDDTPALVDALRALGVTQAWAGTFDGLLHKDIASANARLADECARHGNGLLLPFGSVNPKLPDWEEDLRRCAETFAMRGVRLHPNYHGYALDDPVFARLLTLAAERRLVVQIVTAMEDERMMHPLVQVKPVDVAPLETLVPSVPGARVVLLNATRTVPFPLLPKVVAAGEVCIDIASLEGVAAVANLIDRVPADRIVFGTHAPLFYLESAVLKLAESALPEDRESAIRSGNAARLLAW